MLDSTMTTTVTREIRVLDLSRREPVIRGLRVIRQGQPVLELPLYPDVEYVFGRSRESSVVFSDDAVSRQHGRLWCDANLVRLRRSLDALEDARTERRFDDTQWQCLLAAWFR